MPADDPFDALIFHQQRLHRESDTRSLRGYQAVVGLVVWFNAGYLTDQSRTRDTGPPALREVHVQTSPSKVYVSAQSSVRFVTGWVADSARYIHAT
jgi:hypothetical protein